MLSIFIVDDDPVQSGMLKDFLDRSERNIITINSGEECLKKLDSNPDMIFLDYHFDLLGPDAMNGVEILKQIKAIKPEVEVVMLSSQDKIEVALNTIKYGAFDYVVKGETAFHRAEHIITNIDKRTELKSQIRFYKRLAWSMVGAVIVTVIVIYLVYRMAKAGWFS